MREGGKGNSILCGEDIAKQDLFDLFGFDVGDSF